MAVWEAGWKEVGALGGEEQRDKRICGSLQPVWHELRQAERERNFRVCTECFPTQRARYVMLGRWSILKSVGSISVQQVLPCQLSWAKEGTSMHWDSREKGWDAVKEGQLSCLEILMTVRWNLCHSQTSKAMAHAATCNANKESMPKLGGVWNFLCLNPRIFYLFMGHKMFMNSAIDLSLRHGHGESPTSN